MTNLWLKFVDGGETRRILVEGEKFSVGRHSENDLSIAEQSLSRKHLQIERFDKLFIISDAGSSFGTKLNGKNLDEPAALQNGDQLILGGGFEIKVEIESDEEISTDAEDFSDDEEESDNEVLGENDDLPPKTVSAPTENSGIFSWKLLLLAPLFGCCFLSFAGFLFYVLTGKTQDLPKNDIVSTAPTRTPRFSSADDEDKRETPEPTAAPTAKPSETPEKNLPSLTPVESETPQVSSDADKIERNALAFTRRIAVNDNNYVFSRLQINEINSQIKNFSGSADIRENLKAVRQNSAQFRSLAESKGLKPQFLAAAALAKIGNRRGNPLQTAQELLPVLGELKISLGNELTDDNLLIIAAYEQGTRGEFRAMRTTVEVLSKQPGVDVRRARTIWYLKEKGKLTDAQYQYALRFLAVGSLMQKPADFNVQTEPVIFD